MKKLSVYAAALAALILFPNFIGAQTLTWDETNADTIENNISNGYDPQIAISGDKAVAVWMQSDYIYSNYSTDGGVTWTLVDAQRIDNSDDFETGNPQVVISGDNVVAVWIQKESGGEYRIYSNYSTNGGKDWVGAQPIDNFVAGQNAYGPQIAISEDAGGDTVVVVWYQNFRIWSNYSTNGGTSWKGAQRIDNIEAQAQNPQIAISGNMAVAVWDQFGVGGFVYRRIYSNYATIDGGDTIWDETKADTVSNPLATAELSRIAISGDANGDTVVVVWQHYADSEYHIYSNYATIVAGAIDWDPDKSGTIEIGAGGAENPKIAISGNTVVAVWRQENVDGYFNAYSNYSTNGGKDWVGAQPIEEATEYDAQNPQIAISGNTVVAIWYKYDWNGICKRIYSNYTTIDDTGAVGVWDTTCVDTVSNDAGNAEYPQIAISGDNVVAVWQQDVAGSPPVHIYSNYAQVVADSDNMTGDFGSLPVGPLAAGISAFLVWWKRRKQE